MEARRRFGELCAFELGDDKTAGHWAPGVTNESITDRLCDDLEVNFLTTEGATLGLRIAQTGSCLYTVSPNMCICSYKYIYIYVYIYIHILGASWSPRGRPSRSETEWKC